MATTLFATLNVLDGTVIGMQRQEFIRFLNTIDAEVPAGKAVHLILDNYAAHKHPKVARPARALRLPLHADIVLLAQCRGRLLCQAVQATFEAWRLPIRRRS